VDEIIQQLGNLGRNKDQVADILEDGFQAKAYELKKTGSDLATQALDDLAEVDAGTRERLQSVLGDEATAKVEQIQGEALRGLRSRLRRR
jgi:hypothetical protein